MKVKVIEDRSSNEKKFPTMYFIYKQDYDALSPEDKLHCDASNFGYHVDDYLIEKLKLNA